MAKKSEELKEKKIKKIRDPEMIEFEKEIKLYLSSLSARGSKYMYFNVGERENTLVLSNGNYELLVAYIPVTLTFHLVTFKNDFYTKLLNVLNIPKNTPYILRVDLFLKAIRQFTIEELRCEYDSFLNMRIYSGDILLEEKLNEDSSDENTSSEDIEEGYEEEKITTFAKEDICGMVIDDLPVLTKLKEDIDYINSIDTNELSNMSFYTKERIKDPIDYFYLNWFRPCTIQLPGKEDIYHLLIDGVDTVSLKEFIRKNYPDTVIDMHIWSKYGSSVKYMATYEDENILVKTVRPYREIVPLKKKD